MVSIWKQIEGRARRRAVADQHINVQRRSAANFVFTPLVSETHPIRPSTADAAHSQPTECGDFSVDVAPTAQVPSIVIARDVHHIHTETLHRSQDPIDLEQIFHFAFAVLPFATPRAGEVAHQQDTVKLGAIGQRFQDLIEQRPTGVDVANDSKNRAQNPGFICMIP
jgi:hypothetical protein